MSTVLNGHIEIKVPPEQTVSAGGIIIAGTVPKSVKALVINAGTCTDVAAGDYIAVKSHLVKPLNGTHYVHEDNIEAKYN